jgi:hypothetical protein
MIALLAKLFRREPDPFGLNAAYAFRKQLRLMGYQRPEVKRGR